MSDIEEQLARFGAGGGTGVDDHVVRDDVRRGRTALRRRRARRASVGSVAVVGVLAVGSLAASSLVKGPDGPGVVAHGPVSKPTGTKLVAYDGPAVSGFDFTSVPEGFRLEASDEGELQFSRPGTATNIRDFEDKLVVFLTDETDIHNRKGLNQDWITINGRPADIRQTPGYAPHATELEFEAPGYGIVQVQAWPSLGLTRAQLIEFAGGITVNDQVERTVGTSDH